MFDHPEVMEQYSKNSGTLKRVVMHKTIRSDLVLLRCAVLCLDADLRKSLAPSVRMNWAVVRAAIEGRIRQLGYRNHVAITLQIVDPEVDLEIGDVRLTNRRVSPVFLCRRSRLRTAAAARAVCAAR